jgi:endonuclease-3
MTRQTSKRITRKTKTKKKAATKSAPRPPVVEPERLRLIKRSLTQAIPEPRCELDHKNAWQLLIATILSAQSTDRKVNEVAPRLFRLHPTPASLAEAPSGEIEALIKSTGFFRNKTKSIQGASRLLVEKHKGLVPRTLEELVELPGVARKTANVVLGTVFRIPTGIVVDTHAGRVSRRLELTQQTDPQKVERELCALFPEREWVDTGHRLVLHGRYVCLARAPRCGECALNEACPAREAEAPATVKARADWERKLVESRGQIDSGKP